MVRAELLLTDYGTYILREGLRVASDGRRASTSVSNGCRGDRSSIFSFRPRWSGVKDSDSGRKTPGLGSDYIEETPCKRVWCTLNPSEHNVLPWCDLEVQTGENAGSGVVLIISPRFKITRPVRK
ncbi:hypothetical protein AVEN_165222-1 [Araneus ventricosus]|uniref:Uncharacterized protein n=1 Tax=Araneus ventricosus TaxID=182803 RepID=A0A4Y2B980_ARAVE|nr:hypothetical protein AVEN_165222-1 [Araneus ventricosus]